MQKVKNNDAKSVASKQKHEMQYVCRVWKDAEGKHLKQTALKLFMDKLGKTGKPCRSRAKIYAALKENGYVFS